MSVKQEGPNQRLGKKFFGWQRQLVKGANANIQTKNTLNHTIVLNLRLTVKCMEFGQDSLAEAYGFAPSKPVWSLPKGLVQGHSCPATAHSKFK